MKKTNFMTAVLIIMAVLLMAACTQGDLTQDPATTPSSQGGALMDNTLFGDGNTTTKPTTATTQPTTQPTTAATQPSSIVTQPATAPTQPSSQPATEATQPTTPPAPGEGVDYLTFQAMTGAEQRAFQNSFPDLAAFFEWYNAAKAAYEQANPPIEVGGDGKVTLPTTP